MRSPRHSVVRYVYFDRLEGHRCGSTRLKNNRKGFLVATKNKIAFQLDFNTKMIILHITNNDTINIMSSSKIVCKILFEMKKMKYKIISI